MLWRNGIPSADQTSAVLHGAGVGARACASAPPGRQGCRRSKTHTDKHEDSAAARGGWGTARDARSLALVVACARACRQGKPARQLQGICPPSVLNVSRRRPPQWPPGYVQRTSTVSRCWVWCLSGTSSHSLPTVW